MNSINNYASHTITNYEASGTAHGDFMLNLNSPANLAAIKNVKANNNTRPIRTMAISNGSKNGSAGLKRFARRHQLYERRLRIVILPGRFFKFQFDDDLVHRKRILLRPMEILTQGAGLRGEFSGGNRSSYKQLFDVLSGADYGPRNWTGAYNGHCFIPTASALGLTDININSPSGSLASSGPSMYDESPCAGIEPGPCCS